MTRNLIKACLRCHERKLKCDAQQIGLPCSRCVATRGDEALESCVRVLRRPRTRRRVAKARHTVDTETLNRRNGEQEGNSSCTTPHKIESWTPPLYLGQTSSSSEDDARTPETCMIAQECEQIAKGSSLPSLEIMLEPSQTGPDLVQYHSEMHYMTIISELVDAKKSSRVTRIVVEDRKLPMATRHTQMKTTQVRVVIQGLDPLDEEYLNNKSAFSLPSKHSCEAMLQAYFSLGHPHVPILDPVEFVRSYLSGSFSLFLMQAILANAALYAPMPLLEACGFSERCEAIETYFSRASLLYQFGCERNQLRSLQGSIVLGMTAVTGSFDRDFRYWIHNAVRLAVKMGLHKSFAHKESESPTCKLYQRIWWALYIRDITLLLGGAQNMRMIHAEDNEVLTIPTPESLGDDIPACYAHLIPPLTQQQREYFIEYCRLARIATKCLSILKSHPRETLDLIQSELHLWRSSLPESLQPVHRPSHVRSDSIWHMVLMTSSYRYESMLCRILRKESEGRDLELQKKSAQAVRAAIYELDAIIGRAMAYDMLSMLPMSCISIGPTVLALHLEIVLSPSESEVVKSRSRIYIHQAIVFLQQCRDLPFMKIALDLVDWALTKQNLLSIDKLNAPPPPVASHLHQQEPFVDLDKEASGTGGENQAMANVSVFDVIERLDEFLELGAMDDTMISDLWQNIS
ncbi:hypothetical protein Trisim1_006497 [Trichoderma cf. simile WF8]